MRIIKALVKIKESKLGIKFEIYQNGSFAILSGEWTDEGDFYCNHYNIIEPDEAKELLMFLKENIGE